MCFLTFLSWTLLHGRLAQERFIPYRVLHVTGMGVLHMCSSMSSRRLLEAPSMHIADYLPTYRRIRSPLPGRSAWRRLMVATWIIKSVLFRSAHLRCIIMHDCGESVLKAQDMTPAMTEDSFAC